MNDGCLKDVSIKDALIFTSIAWDKVTAETIKNCFKVAFMNEKKHPENNNSSEENKLNDIVEECIYNQNDCETDTSTEDELLIDQESEIKEALKSLEGMHRSCKLLTPENLKSFYLYRIEFMKILKRKYGFGKK